MYKHECIVNALTKTPNALYGRSFWALKVERDRWKRLIYTNFKSNPPKAPLKKVRLEITRYSPKKLMDTDNLYASMKHLIDALKKNGIIIDDAPKHLELICKQEKGKIKEPMTKIVIEEVA